MKNKKIKIRVEQTYNKLKSDFGGLAISRSEIAKGYNRFRNENESLLAEAQREQSVIRMKRFYTNKGWSFPPKSLSNLTMVQLINGYYGKEVTKYKKQKKIY